VTVKHPGGFKRARRGTGYPAILRGELKLAILSVFAAVGWWLFGLNSIGTAVLATPLLVYLSYLMIAAAGMIGGVSAMRHAGSTPFVLKLGPLGLTSTVQATRIETHNNPMAFTGSVVAATRPGRHDSFPEGIAALFGGSAVGSLVLAIAACGLLYRCIITGSGPLPLWSVFLLTVLSALEVVQWADRSRQAKQLHEPGPLRQRMLLANTINASIREGRRPATWSLDLFDNATEEDAVDPRGDAERHYFAYYALLDRGNVVAAGDRIDLATQSALQAIRNGKDRGEDQARIFAEMAYFTAFHRGDAERGRAWLDLCTELWLDPDQRRRAEAAVLFAEGNRPAARTLAVRVHRDLMKWSTVGDEGDWVAEIIRACDGEPRSPESNLARGRNVTTPPLVINAHGARLPFRLGPWLCLFASLLLVACVASSVGTDSGGAEYLKFVVFGLVVLLLLIFGFVMYLMAAHSWIEVTAEGVGYSLSRKMYWLDWATFRGSGQITRAPFAARGLVLNERVTLQNARGPSKQIGGVPLSFFAPGWRTNHVGAAIRRYAPHLLTTEVRPTGWFN
jgi:hypothetical protein